MTTSNAPHYFRRNGWRFWLCLHCYRPRSMHPVTVWVKSRPISDHTYLSKNAPHFKTDGDQ